MEPSKIILKGLAVFLCISGCIFLSGCADQPSDYTPYPQQLSTIKQDLAQGKTQAAEQNLQSNLTTGDWQLYSLELGRIQQLSGDYADSIKTYGKVIDAINAQLLSPKFKLGTYLHQNLSAGNENDVSFSLAPYQMILLYQYQGINYLATGDLTDALVNFRQLQNVMAYLKLNYLPTLAEEPKTVRMLDDLPSFTALMNDTAHPTSLDSSLENPAAAVIEALSFYNAKDYNDALVTLRALPDSVLKDPRIQRLNQLFNKAQTDGDSPTDKPTVVLIEMGYVPTLQEYRHLFSNVDNSGYDTVFILPYYAPPAPAPAPAAPASASAAANPALPSLTLSTTATTDSGVSPSVLFSPSDAAALSLLENYPNVINQANNYTGGQIDDIDQAEQQYQQDEASIAKKDNSVLQQMMDDALAETMDFALVNNPDNDAADLRSWSLLPAQIQMAVLDLPAGATTLTLAQDGKTILSCPVTIKKHKVGLIWINLQLAAPICQQLF